MGKLKTMRQSFKLSKDQIRLIDFVFFMLKYFPLYQTKVSKLGSNIQVAGDEYKAQAPSTSLFCSNLQNLQK